MTTEDRALSLRQLATVLAGMLSGDCHNQQEAQEVMRLLQEQLDWIYTGQRPQP
jgi:hypothetical protein